MGIKATSSNIRNADKDVKEPLILELYDNVIEAKPRSRSRTWLRFYGQMLHHEKQENGNEIVVSPLISLGFQFPIAVSNLSRPSAQLKVTLSIAATASLKPPLVICLNFRYNKVKQQTEG